MQYGYITQDIFERTKSKLLRCEIDRDRLSIVNRGGVFWIESRGTSERGYKIAVRETEKIFPNLKYLYKINKGGRI